MNQEISMSVSSMTGSDGEKTVYVLFQDANKTAELKAPTGKLIRNSGFSDEEIAQLKDYVKNEQETILALAKQINPMRAFLGEPPVTKK